MANPTNSLPSTLAWASNVAPAVSATSSLTATVNVLPTTVSTTIPTVNAVPVVNSLPSAAGTMNVTSTPNMNMAMSTPTVNALSAPQLSAPQVAQVAAPAPAVMATSTTNTAAIPSVVPSSLPLQGSPSRAPLRAAPIASSAGADLNKVLDKQRLSELVKEVDPLEQLDDDVEDDTYLPTPDISHLSMADYDHVYEPAEDSFLLLDALEKEKSYIKRQVKPLISLEIGSGSGVISTFLAQLLGPDLIYLTTDINPKAAEITMRTGKQNCIVLNPVLTDLSSALEDRLKHQIDILMFNPPYVVTPSEEVGSSGIEASWAGGDRGREVVDRFFPVVHTLLSKRGVFYLVIIKENNQNEIEQIMKGYGFKMSVVMSRRSGPEFLSILKFVRG